MWSTMHFGKKVLRKKSTKFGLFNTLFTKQSKPYVITWIISFTYFDITFFITSCESYYKKVQQLLWQIILLLAYCMKAAISERLKRPIFMLDFKDINNSIRASLFLYKMHILTD